MAEIKQIAQAKILMSPILMQKRDPPNRQIGLPTNSFVFVFVFVHIYPPFTRKRIVSLYFGRDVRTRLGVAIF